MGPSGDHHIVTIENKYFKKINQKSNRQENFCKSNFKSKLTYILTLIPTFSLGKLLTSYCNVK